MANFAIEFSSRVVEKSTQNKPNMYGSTVQCTHIATYEEEEEEKRRNGKTAVQLKEAKQ